MKRILKAAQYGMLITVACSIMCGEDITLPLDTGHVLIDARFIRVDEAGRYIPEFSFKIENHTTVPWWNLSLRFEISGLCNGEPKQWTVDAGTSLGWSEDLPVGNAFREIIADFVDKVDGCRADSIKAELIVAQNGTVKIFGKNELERRRQAKLKREARESEESLQAEKENAAAALRIAKEEADERRETAEGVRKIRASCMVIYQSTIDKRLSDLTVREGGLVRTCQSMGLYPPPVLLR